MEPVAPGTEEDVLQMPAVSKKSTEQERLLSIKAYLKNGRYDNVFELCYNNGCEQWYCRICKCPIMGRVYHHEGGKRHTQNMETATKYAKEQDGNKPSEKKSEQATSDMPNIRIAPGEPVPPGFEGEIVKVAKIQERLDLFQAGSLLGLEYLLEIQDYDHDKEPSYQCLLCGKRGDPRTVLSHLVSYNHIQGYLQRHFPKTYQALAPFMTRQFKKNWQDAINKIAEAIETKYGRLLPHPVDADTFNDSKEKLYQMVHLGPHFSEKNGVTFEDLVDKEELTRLTEEEMRNELMSPNTDPTNMEAKPAPGTASKVDSKKRSPSPPVVQKPKKPRPSGIVERKRLSSVSSISSSDLSDFEDKKKPPVAERSPRHPVYERRRSRSPRYNRSRFEKRSPSPRRRRPNAMPWNRPDYVRIRKDTPGEPKNRSRDDKMEEFRKLSIAIETDMEKTLRQHKSNPEKHPHYNEEWKFFWNRRYKELQTEGEDPSKHDFKPEWIVYWNKKMEEFHKEDVKVKVEALRKRLGLCVSEPTPISFKIGNRKKGAPASDAKVQPTAAQVDSDVIVIEDKDDSPPRSSSPWESEPRVKKPPLHNDRYSKRSRERSFDRSSRERREYGGRDRDYGGRDRDRDREKSWERDIGYHRESRKEPSEYYKPPQVMRDVTRKPVDYLKTPEPEDDGDINIVAVLRLLTALEDKLGSLGPKVIDMLAQALAMEKKEPNSSETLLDNEINCVLFETVKEKLKGLLHAGLVPYSQEKTYKTSITKIASLLHLASTRSKERSKASVGTVDKAAIAKQIATALVLQGKTDVTQAELEQLINAVVGMAEASKNSDKPVTTATFLQTMANKPPEEPAPIEIRAVSEPAIVQPTTSTILESSPPKDNAMDGLSDSDLQTLLQNFKDLSPEEQHGLITYLKKLESKEPARVEKLRKFVNMDKPEEPIKEPTGRISPFSRKLNNSDMQNPTTTQSIFEEFADEPQSEPEEFEEEMKPPPPEIKPVVHKPIPIDSEDDDYSYEDVFKAADKNVQERRKEKERKIIEDSIKRDSKIEADVLTDAKALIANIMVSIASKSNSSSNSVDSPKSEHSNIPPVVQNKPQSQTTTQSQATSQSQTTSQSQSATQSQPGPSVQQFPPKQNVPQPQTGFPHANKPPQNVQMPFQPLKNQMGHNNNMQYPRMPYNQPQRGGFNNPNVGYPNMNNPYGGNFHPQHQQQQQQQNYPNNFNYSNQFKQNNRFNQNPRGQFNNNRGGGGGGGNFNNRW